MAETVNHDEANQRFVIATTAGDAEVRYRLQGNRIDLHTTKVPSAARGAGIAARLVGAAFDYARDHNLRVVPSCPYISDTFLYRHPAYRSLVAD